MSEKSIEIVTRGLDEYSALLEKVERRAESLAERVLASFTSMASAAESGEAGLEEMREGYSKVGESTGELVQKAEELCSALEKTRVASQALREEGAKGMKDAWAPFWFLKEKEEEDYKKLRTGYFQESLRWAEEFTKQEIKLKEEEFTAMAGYDRLHEESVKSRTAVVTKSYDAMGAQLLKFIETNRFSARAFGEAVAQQVKIELIGLAARASVWAIFETAMGLKDLAMGLPTAALHFKSAWEFGAVAGASLLGAAGIQGAFFEGAHKEPSGGSGSGAASLGGATLPAGLDAGSPQATQNITVHIYNPLSEQNWQKIVEDNIIPAINGASEKNISVVVKTV